MDDTLIPQQPVRWLRLKQLKEIRSRSASSLWNEVKQGLVAAASSARGEYIGLAGA